MEKIRRKIRQLLDKKRYKHTLRVARVAVKLAKYWKIDIEKARIAALLHDLGRQFEEKELLGKAKEYHLKLDNYEKENPLLLHGRVAVEIAKKEYGMKKKDVLGAISLHTTGAAKMTKLEKIIYLADFIEPGRKFRGVSKLREFAFQNLNKAVAWASKNTIKYLVKEKITIHPKTKECYFGYKE